MRMELLEAEGGDVEMEPDSGVKAIYWSPRWFPFAGSVAGDFLCIDMVSKGGVSDRAGGGQTDPAINATSVGLIQPIALTSSGRPNGSRDTISFMTWPPLLPPSLAAEAGS